MYVCVYVCNINVYVHPGFSLGGLLACSITAAVWDTPYIRADVLKRSLVCITFGQPHIALPAVAKVAREQPEMVSVIHTIHLQDDVFPRLLSVLNECCSELGPKEEKGGIKLKAPYVAKLVRSVFCVNTKLLLRTRFVITMFTCLSGLVVTLHMQFFYPYTHPIFHLLYNIFCSWSAIVHAYH